MYRLIARRVFFALTILTAMIAAYSYVHRSEIFKPDACTCREIFSGDSALAMHAARRVVGNGFYVFTIPAGQQACASAYEQLPGIYGGRPRLTEMQQRALKVYFDSACVH